MSLFRCLETPAVSHSARLHSHAHPHTHPRHNLAPVAPDLSALFVRALARAGQCPLPRPRTLSLSPTLSHSHPHHPHRPHHPPWLSPAAPRRAFSSRPHLLGPLKKVRQFAAKELRAMVDYYGIDTEPRPDIPPPDDGPLIWNVGDDHQPWSLPSPQHAQHAARLERLLEDDESPPQDVFAAYKLLPAPGVVYLPTLTIRALLHHLSVVERPSLAAMQRYLSALDDMKTANIHITLSEWTSAVYLAGRCMGRVSPDELQSALYIWRDMEHRAGVKGGYVTLNILFDLAVKAAKYSLAETFLKELHARGLKLHRHFRISLIYYYGIMQDGHAVRRSYQELVDAGDIVDTVVMNAVIAALFRAGEPSAAEHVFERMKRAHANRKLPAPGHTFYNRNWRDRRSLGLYLTHHGSQLSKQGHDDKLKELQDYAPIAPDSRTYALIIRHQATSVGNIDRIYELFREMRYNSVPLEGTIFIVMFQGFHSFGGVRYSSWTPDRLEKLWSDFVQAEADKLPRTYFSTMAVVAVLKAFKRCTDTDRTLRVWDQVREIWHPNEEELENVMRELRKLMPQPGFFNASQIGDS